MNRPLFPRIYRGDIYYVDFGNQPGSVIHGVRPAMVVQNDVGNWHSTTLIVAAITTELKLKRQPTHIMLGTQFDLPRESMLLLEQLATIDKIMLQTYVGTADEAFMKKVDRALSISVGIKPINFSKRKDARWTPQNQQNLSAHQIRSTDHGAEDKSRVCE